VLLGGAGQEFGREVVEDLTGPLPRGVNDAESLSSGSSIELLDVSDEGPDLAAAESPSHEQDSDVKMVDAVSKEAGEETNGAGDAEQLVTLSSSAGHSAGGAAASDSLTGDAGDVAVQSSVDALAATASETTRCSEDEAGDNNDQVAEAGDSFDGCHQSTQEVEPRRNPVTSSSVDPAVTSELHVDIVGDSARSDTFTLWCCITGPATESHLLAAFK